jgi:ACT domain
VTVYRIVVPTVRFVDVHPCTPETYVVRVWLPDRPGALGSVASRIGAVGGDVIGIEILERGGGMAVDDLTVRLADPSLIELLAAEVRQVDGAAVEDLRRVDPDRPDPGLLALTLGAGVLATPPHERERPLADAVAHLVEADWVVVWAQGSELPSVVVGTPPDLAWLRAFLDGSRHLGGGAADLACGRAGRVFHTRERDLVAALVHLVDVAAP